jgi:hypothetical protein
MHIQSESLVSFGLSSVVDSIRDEAASFEKYAGRIDRRKSRSQRQIIDVAASGIRNRVPTHINRHSPDDSETSKLLNA